MEEEAVICAYNLESAPIAYVGELYYDERDTEGFVMIFKNAIIRVAKARQTGEGMQPTIDTGYIRVPLSGRESTVHIDTRIIKGVLVKNIDQEEIFEYRNAHTRLHSKLHLAP